MGENKTRFFYVVDADKAENHARELRALGYISEVVQDRYTKKYSVYGYFRAIKEPKRKKRDDVV